MRTNARAAGPEPTAERPVADQPLDPERSKRRSRSTTRRDPIKGLRD